MNFQTKMAGGLALTLMAAAAVVLSKVQSIQRLGTPGVRVVEHKIHRDDGVLVGTNSIPLPEQVLNYKSHEEPIPKVVTDWLPKDTTYAQRIYQAPDGFWIQANVVLMGTDRTSIHDPKYCLAGQGFQTEKVEQLHIEIQKPHRYLLPVVKMTVHREAVLADGTKVPQSALYVFWFVADQQLTSDHKERMWWMARDLVTKGVLQRWAYVSCFSACPPGQEDATYARISEWIATAVPQFQHAAGSIANLASNPE